MMLKNTLFILLILTFVACNGGGGSSGGNNTPSETIPSGPTWTVSGTITYDFVPITSSGLNYAGITQKPVRNVKIQARNVSGNGLVANGTTDDSGAFTIVVPKSVSNYYINVFAQMATPSVVIEDNTNSNAVYVAQTGNKTNTADATLSNINLASGWGSTSYTGTRYSAPFAILDTIYTGYQKMLAARGDFLTGLPTLKVNWSKDNYASPDYDVSTGEIVTSHFDGNELYILGLDGSDTDEFDRHVIVHEWGHFVEAFISRSDSIGGSHSTGNKLQISTAFGEGWGNALSAIVLDPLTTYRDSYGASQGTAFGFDMENGADPFPGWFSEASAQQIIFDVYDGSNEAADTVALGLGPIIDVLRGGQKLTPALTSIFSFVSYLRAANGSSSAAIDNLVSAKSITPNPDIYGTGETHNGSDADTLPIYNVLAHNTAVAKSIGGGTFRYNEMRNNRYYRWVATSTSSRFTLTCSAYCYVEARLDGKSLGYLESTTGSATIATVVGKEYIFNLTTDTTAAGAITTSFKAEAL